MKSPLVIKPKAPVLTLADFCGLHNLSIHVHERDPETRSWGGLAAYRYYADIPHLEVAESEVIYSTSCGHGNTIKSAIMDLTKRMSDKEVRVDHRYIRVPKLKVR